MSPIRRSLVTLGALVVAAVVAQGPATTLGATAAEVPSSPEAPAELDHALYEEQQVVVHPDGTVSVSVAVGTATAGTARTIDAACDGRWAHPFLDLGDSPHAASIACLVGLEVAQGRTPTTYDVHGDVTRAQMASFVARALDVAGAGLPTQAPDAFGDDQGSVHETAIDRLAAAGIVSGTGHRTYSPGEPVTRAQMATFVVRAAELYAGVPLPSGGDAFVDTSDHALRANIDKAARAGIAAGTGDGRYEPQRRVTRSQMASFLARTLDLLVVEYHAVLPPPATGTPTAPATPTTSTTTPTTSTTSTSTTSTTSTSTPSTSTTTPSTTAPPTTVPTVTTAPTTTVAPLGIPPYDADHAFIFPAGQYGTTGPGRWNPCQVITYRVDPSGATSAQVAAVVAALADAAVATGIAMQPTTGAAQVEVAFVPGTDERVLGGVVGRAYVSGRYGATNLWIDSASVVFDRDDLAGAQATNGPGITWGAVARHEFGHAFGLSHAATTAQVMYPSLSSRSPYPWGPGDRYGLYQVGAAQGCRTS